MLEEAVGIIRRAWAGKTFSHRGRHYTVQNARVYTLPTDLPPVYLAAGGDKAARQAANLGDGLIATGPDASLLRLYDRAGGSGPRTGQVTLSWASTEKAARKTALEWWPNAAIHGEASQELPNPTHFEQLAEAVTEDQIAEEVSCGPDPAVHLAKIKEYVEAGFDQVYLHQVGPDQAGFIEFAARELIPALEPALAH
jgi:G6PDH family F420-dependent oxidoreductase